jgi:hypothetical protein
MSDILSSLRTATADSDYSSSKWNVTPTRLAVGHISHPSADADQLRRQRFVELARQWAADTMHMSCVSDMTSHPSYRAVIDLGLPAVPLILDQLERDPDFWFEALRAITGQDPVLEEDIGDLPRMTQAWLDWGEQNGYR